MYQPIFQTFKIHFFRCLFMSGNWEIILMMKYELFGGDQILRDMLIMKFSFSSCCDKTLWQRNVSIRISASVSFQFLCCKKLLYSKTNIQEFNFLARVYSYPFLDLIFHREWVTYLLCWKSFSSFILLNHFKKLNSEKVFDSLYTTLTRTIC